MDGVRCGVHTPRRLQQTTVSCKRSNCNKFIKILKVDTSEVLWKRRHTTGLPVLSCRFLHELSCGLSCELSWTPPGIVSLPPAQLEEELDDECHCLYAQNGTGLSCLSPDSWWRRLNVVNASLKSDDLSPVWFFLIYWERSPILSVSKVLFLRH